MITLTIEKVAKERGVNSQKELHQKILDETGIFLRPATISDIYRNNKTQINRVHLETIMKALDITDFNEVLKMS